MSCREFLLTAIAVVVFPFVFGSPVEVIYTGKSCGCANAQPLQVKVPSYKPSYGQKLSNYGYQVESPKAAKAEVKYTVDFEYEKPDLEQEKVKLQSFGYKLGLPFNNPNDRNYRLDALVQYPVTNQETYEPLDGYIKVDRIVEPAPDCVSKGVSRRYHRSLGALATFPFYSSTADNELAANYYRCDIADSTTRSKRDLRTKKCTHAKNYGSRLRKRLSNPNINRSFKRPLMDRRLVKRDAENSKNASNHKLFTLVYGKEETIAPEILDEFLTHHSQQPSYPPEVIQYLPEVLSPDFVKSQCYNRKKTARPVPYSTSPTSYMEFIDGSPVEYKLRERRFEKAPEKRYVYDRLGHKYEENGGSLRLLGPHNYGDQLNPDYVQPTEEYYGSHPQDGNIHWDDFLRKVIADNKDFIDATDYGKDTLGPTEDVQREGLERLALKVIDGHIRRLNDEDLNPEYHANFPKYTYDRHLRSLEKEFQLIPVAVNEKAGSYLVEVVPKTENQDKEQGVPEGGEQQKQTKENSLSEKSLKEVADDRKANDENLRKNVNFFKIKQNGRTYEILTTKFPMRSDEDEAMQ